METFQQTVDIIDISIHFNSGADDQKGNGRITGTEVLVYSKNTKALLLYWKQLGWNKNGKKKGRGAGLQNIKS